MLLLRDPQMLRMQVSTQADKHKCSKKVRTKKSALFKKMGLKFWNPKFNILYQISFILFFQTANPLEFKGQ